MTNKRRIKKSIILKCLSTFLIFGFLLTLQVESIILQPAQREEEEVIVDGIVDCGYTGPIYINWKPWEETLWVRVNDCCFGMRSYLVAYDFEGNETQRKYLQKEGQNQWEDIAIAVPASGEVWFWCLGEPFVALTECRYIFIPPQIIGYDPPIYEDIVAFPTPEHHLGLDLNNDFDTNDTIMCYLDLETNRVVNTKLIVSGVQHAIDLYENTIAFVDKDSYICYYDINTGTVGKTGVTGFHPSIYGNIIAFASKGTIHYFDLSTQTLVNTKVSGYSPAIYQGLIVFHAFDPNPTICIYDLHTGAIVDTKIIGRSPTLYGTVVTFETPEALVVEDLNNDGDTYDLVIQYYDLTTKTVTNTSAVGEYPIVYGNRIVFTTPEKNVKQDLNGDGKIFGSVILYYDLDTRQMINTLQLGIEPDIYGDTISFYLWEEWIGLDFNGDGDLCDPIMRTYKAISTEMTLVDSRMLHFEPI